MLPKLYDLGLSEIPEGSYLCQIMHTPDYSKWSEWWRTIHKRSGITNALDISSLLRGENNDRRVNVWTTEQYRPFPSGEIAELERYTNALSGLFFRKDPYLLDHQTIDIRTAQKLTCSPLEQHSLRVGHIASGLWRYFGDDQFAKSYFRKLYPEFDSYIAHFQEIETVLMCIARMHDFGKLVFPTEIRDLEGKVMTEQEIVKHLLNPNLVYGPREKVMIKYHPFFSAIIQYLFGASDLFKKVTLQHHENHYGVGYYGLREDEIHLLTWFISAADVFDAKAIDTARLYSIRQNGLLTPNGFLGFLDSPDGQVSIHPQLHNSLRQLIYEIAYAGDQYPELERAVGDCLYADTLNVGCLPDLARNWFQIRLQNAA